MEAAQIEKPRFRTDLVAQPLEESGVQYVDVTDPNSGATFRFYDVEYSIACAMDGAKDLAGLAEWTRTELGIETSPDELAGVVGTLAELGYLEADPFPSPSTQPESFQVPSVDTEVGIKHPAHPTAPLEPEASFHFEPTVKGGEALSAAVRAEADIAEDQAAASQTGDDLALEITADLPEEGSLAFPEVSDDREEVPESESHEEDEGQALEVDLGAHIRLDREVKEAVRASQRFSIPEIAANIGDPVSPTENTGEAHAASLSPPVPTPGVEVPQASQPDPRPRQRFAAPDVARAVDPPSQPSQRFAAPDVARAVDPPSQPSQRFAIPARQAAPEEQNPESVFADLAEEVFPAEADPPTPGSNTVLLPEAPPPSIRPLRMVASSLEPEFQRTGRAPLVFALLGLSALGALGYFYFTQEPHEPPPLEASIPIPVASPSANGANQAAKETPAIPPDEPPQAEPAEQPADEPLANHEPQESAVAKPEPALPSAIITEVTDPGVAVLANEDGKIGWMVKTGQTVQEGEVVAKRIGFAKLEQSLEEPRERLRHYQRLLAEAEASRNGAGEAAARTKIAEKERKIADIEAEMANYSVKAPVAGTVKAVVTVGKVVEKGTVVARIGGGQKELIAQFKDVGTSQRAGKPCVVASKMARDRQYACVVDNVENGTVTVHIVDGSSAKASDEVVLLPAPK